MKAHGFDLSGIDIWAAGTLYKNISFSVLPSADSSGNFHFENAFVRLDNLLKSHWLNVKFGKFELDNVISEKRFLFLSANGGLYQTYHFTPVGDSNNFGLGDNQLGLELSGHSANSYTRYGAALLSSNDGNVGLPANRGYDTYLTFSQAFEAGRLGLERFGVYAYIGERPTFSLTSSAIPGAPTGGTTAIPGTGAGNKPFYRVGFAGNLHWANSNSCLSLCMGMTMRFSEPRRQRTNASAWARALPSGTAGLSKRITSFTRNSSLPSATRSSGCHNRRSRLTLLTRVISPHIQWGTVGTRSCLVARDSRGTTNTLLPKP